MAWSRILLAGDSHHADFSSVRAWLARCGATLEEEFAADSLGSPEAILLFQSRPGQFSQSFVDAWHERFPFARLVAILGSWCEGETRSGRPWQGTERCFWYEAIARLQAEWHASPPPRTLSPVDRCEYRLPCSFPRGNGAIVVAAKSRLSFEVTADTLRSAGYAPIDEPSAIAHAPIAWLLAGEDLYDGWTLATAARLHQRWPAIPGIALLKFPRAEEVAALKRLGVQTVLGQPYFLSDLTACMLNVTNSRESCHQL